MFQPLRDDVQPGTAVEPHPRGQEGFILLAVLFMLVLVVLSMAIAAPKMATELQREKEIETIHRGMEYARAIRMYYRQFGSYPNSIDQLVKTNNERFLRKRYLDPLTGKDDWRLIHMGEAQTMGTGIAGASPIGANGASGQNGQGASSLGSSGPASSGSGGGMSPSGSGDSGFSLGNSGSGNSGFGNSGSGNSGFSLGDSASSNSGSSNSGFSLGTSASGNSPGGSPTSSNGTGSSTMGSFGQNLASGPIVGVGLPSKAASLKIFRKQSHYNQWEFIYDPSQDLGGAMGQTGAGILQQPGASNGINGTTPGAGGSAPGSPSSGGGFSLGSPSGGSSPGGSSNGDSGFGAPAGTGNGGTGNGGTGAQPTNPPTEMDSPIN